MKVNVGSSKPKKSFFPISFDSSTTTNFGECIPTFCQEVVSDSHVNLDVRHGVRFAPLSLPTFGKAYLHTYSFCHKLCDLYPPYNNMISRTPYTSGSGNVYIPDSVPYVPLSLLWLMVLSHCDFSIYEFRPNITPITSENLPVQFRTDGYVPYSPSVPTGGDLSHGIIVNLIYSSVFPASVRSSLNSYIFSNSRADDLVCPKGATISRYIDSTKSTDNRVPVTPQGADFVIPLNSNLYYYGTTDGNFPSVAFPTGKRYVACIRLNNTGKYLRKIFMGLGYQITPFAKPVSFLPIFAYYRSYFDTFAPKRFIAFEQTYFGRMMAESVSSGISNLIKLFTSTSYQATLSGMIDDLLSCYYTKDTDYYTSQIIGLVNDYGSNVKQDYIGVASDDTPSGQSLYSNVGTNVVPSLDFSVVNHTQAQQNVLARLTEFVNRRSVLGGKISDLLESVFGIKKKDVLDDNPYLGSDVVDVDFSDVFSTAETAEGSLGEYAGRASASGYSNNINVDTSSPSLVLSFSVVVPRTQFCQGVNPNLFHVHYDDFYNPMFDGLTLLPTDRLSFVAPSPLGFETDVVDNVDSFGNAPVYSEYKVATQGILNGDLSLKSTKASYDSFTMDTMISDYTFDDSSISDNVIVSYSVRPYLPSFSAGTMWRYIGRWLWLGNYDRIFVNTKSDFNSSDFFSGVNSRDITRSSDNLTVHNIVDLKINAPMLPTADSFMTRDIHELNNGYGVTAQSE